MQACREDVYGVIYVNRTIYIIIIIIILLLYNKWPTRGWYKWNCWIVLCDTHAFPPPIYSNVSKHHNNYIKDPWSYWEIYIPRISWAVHLHNITKIHTCTFICLKLLCNICVTIICNWITLQMSTYMRKIWSICHKFVHVDTSINFCKHINCHIFPVSKFIFAEGPADLWSCPWYYWPRLSWSSLLYG